MKLTKHQLECKERGTLAKGFLDSDFYTKYFYPHLEEFIIGEYPKPEGDWEDKYRNFYNRIQIAQEIVKALKAWADEAQALSKAQNEPEKDFMEA
jgi:hypothetical protein